MEELSADDQAALREDLAAAGACADCGQPVAANADGTPGPCLFCGSLGAGAAHLLLDEELPDAGAPAAAAEPPVSAGAADDGGDAPSGRILGEPANEPIDLGESAKQPLASAPAGDDSPLEAGGRQGPAASDPPLQAAALDDPGPNPAGGRGGAALSRDEPIRAGQSAASTPSSGRIAGATLQVGAVRAAPGTEGDPPQSLGADSRPDDAGGDRIQAAADTPTPAPTAAPGVPVAPVDPSLTAASNANGTLHGSEFDYQDAEGAPFADGTRRHAGYDLFAEPNAPVRSPISGTIVEVRASRGNSGQVFGGTVKIQGADGKVWVFRHVDPAALTEGQQVVAGQQVANVTAWTGGQSHIHVERWLTFEGGYNGSNMVDPLPELTAAYTGQPSGIPPEGLAPGQQQAQVPAAGAAAVTDPEVLYKNAVQDLLANPNLTLPEGARADLEAGVVDPRLVIMLTKLSEKHQISLSVIKTGHGQYVAGTTSESNHFRGRGIDISYVDGQIVRPDSPAARILAEELGSMGPPLVPDEIGSPFSIGSGPPYFTDGAHQDHIHVGFDGDIPPGTVLPYPDSAQPEGAAAVLEPSKGRKSGVFAAVRAAEAQQQQAAGAAARRGMTVKFMPAVTAADPTAAPQAAATPQPVAADLPPGQVIPADQFDPGDVTPHPGPTASHAQVAQWMAQNAQRVGLPPELPVMAAITESGLRYGLTPDVSDADSGGYFQMRVSIWNIPPWTNYMNEPEKQLHWFLSQALALKEKRIAEGITNFGQARDPASLGLWCADVERPAAQYRGRYETHFNDAQQLISGQRDSL